MFSELVKIMLLVPALLLFPLTGRAADVSDLTYTTTNGAVTITDCLETARGTLIIPATLDGNPVTCIGYAAFSFCASLTSMTLPDSVMSLGNEAFSDCTSLTSMTLGNRVTSIGDWAFFLCRDLTNIYFDGDAPSVGTDAFAGIASGAKTYVFPVSASGFGGTGATWNGLAVEILDDRETPSFKSVMMDADQAAKADFIRLSGVVAPSESSIFPPR